MKNLIFLIASVFIFSSCGTKESGVSSNMASKPIYKETALTYSNPANMAGSDLGTMVTSLLKTQNYNLALKFTSRESIDKFGQDAILASYKTFDCNYSLKLASVDETGPVSILKFTTNEFATGKFKVMSFVRENDTCKVVLGPNKEIFPS